MEIPAKPLVADAQRLLYAEQLRRERRLRELKENQSLGRGLVGGVLGASVGAVLWAIITAVTGYQIGWMAVGVGVLVGYGVRILGKGIEPVFGYVGAFLSLMGCLVGNLLAVCIGVSIQQGIPLPEFLSRLNPEVTIAFLTATFQPLDLLFYGIGVYEGYKFSVQPRTGDHPVKPSG